MRNGWLVRGALLQQVGRGWILCVVLILAGAIAARARASEPPARVSAYADQAGTNEEQADAALLRDGGRVAGGICAGCHDVDSVYTRRRTSKEWSETVDDMVTRGASGNAAQFAIIKRYLTRTYGLVPVNTATPADLVAVLGLSTKHATVVVAYRKAHGAFADLAALLQVEGVDKARIQAQPEALDFKR